MELNMKDFFQRNKPAGIQEEKWSKLLDKHPTVSSISALTILLAKYNEDERQDFFKQNAETCLKILKENQKSKGQTTDFTETDLDFVNKYGADLLKSVTNEDRFEDYQATLTSI